MPFEASRELVVDGARPVIAQLLDAVFVVPVLSSESYVGLSVFWGFEAHPPGTSMGSLNESSYLSDSSSDARSVAVRTVPQSISFLPVALLLGWESFVFA